MSSNSSPHWLAVLTLRPDLRDLTVWRDAEKAVVAEHFGELQHLAADGAVVMRAKVDPFSVAARGRERTS